MSDNPRSQAEAKAREWLEIKWPPLSIDDLRCGDVRRATRERKVDSLADLILSEREEERNRLLAPSAQYEEAVADTYAEVARVVREVPGDGWSEAQGACDEILRRLGLEAK